METKIGDEETTVNITMNNLAAGEEEKLEWKVDSIVWNGLSSHVIMFENFTGWKAVSSKMQFLLLLEKPS